METGRTRTRTYQATNEDQAKEKARQDGTDPTSVELIPPPPPTERQLEYARGVGIQVPSDANKDELSDLLSIYEDRDKPATDRHREFAKHFRIETTRYVGKKRLFEMIFAELRQPGNEVDLIAWFTFRVYRELTEASDSAPIKHPGDQKIRDIAKLLAEDEKVIKSIRRYRGEDLIWFGQWTAPDGITHYGGSNRTTAYKAAAEALREGCGISRPAARRPRNAQKASKQSGCLGALVAVGFTPAALGYIAWML